MDKINALSRWIQIITITILTLRVVMIFLALQRSNDEKETMKKRLKNTLYWLVLSQMAFVIFEIIKRYYQ